MQRRLLALLVLAAATRGSARQLPGHRSPAFSEAGHVYPAMQLFCNATNSFATPKFFNREEQSNSFYKSFDDDAEYIRNGEPVGSDGQRSGSFCIGEPLRLGAWNLQRFGISKMNKDAVVDVIVKVVHNYDLMVLQEVTDSSGTAIPELLLHINKGLESGEQYSVQQSPRIGRTSYKEQYAFVFKPSRMSFVTGYKYDDMTDIFQIEPFVAEFATSSAGPLKHFVVIPLHAKPSAAVEELDALVDVYDDMVAKLNITDALFMGDFNAGCNYVVQGEYEEMRIYTDQRFHWLISDHADTTTKTTSCPYDRIVVSGEALQHAIYYKTASTYYFDEDFGIESNWALVEDISDHYPVGVMIRGTVPSSVTAAYTQPLLQSAPLLEPSDVTADSRQAIGVRMSVSVELPPQRCWAEVMALVHGTQTPSGTDACAPLHQSGLPYVVTTPDIAMLEWRSSSMESALETLIGMSDSHPQLVTKEAVAVVGYKAGHGVLYDRTIYQPDSEPRDVRLSLLCHQSYERVPRCTITLSAATDIN